MSINVRISSRSGNTKLTCKVNIVRAESNEAAKAIKALYILNEKIQIKSLKLKNHYEYDIFPLEGIWRLIKQEVGFSKHPKNLIGKFMIKQPLFITEDCKSLPITSFKINSSLGPSKAPGLRI